MSDLQADLGLDLTQALRQVDELGRRLDAATAGVEVDASGFRQATREADRLERETDQVGDNLDRSTREARGLGRALKGAIAFIGAREVARGLMAVVDAASDLEESSSKAATIFEDSFTVIEEGLESSTASLILANDQYLETTANIGGFFIAQGLARDAAADLSVAMTDLAADISSFNNIPVQDAIQTLMSGLAGEIEPLRRLGISFNAAAVEAKALELGLVDTGGELSEIARLQARAALIFEQTTITQGDLIRTQESYSNQVRQLQRDWRNTQAVLGELLLPTFKEFVEVLRSEGIDALEDLGPALADLVVVGVREGIPLFRALIDVFTRLTPLLERFANLIEILPAGMLTFAAIGFRMARAMRAVHVASSGAAAGGLARLGLALTGPVGIAAAIAATAVALDDLDQRLDALNVDVLTDALEGAPVETARQAGEDLAAALTSRFADQAAQQFGPVLDRALSRIDVDTAKQVFAQIARDVIEAGGDITLLIDQLDRFGPTARDVLTDMLGLGRSMDTAGVAAAGFGAELEGVEGDLEDTRTAAERYADALEDAIGGQVDADQAAIDFRQSLHDLHLTLAEGNNSLDISTERGREVQSAFIDVAQSIQTLTQATLDQTGSVAQANAVMTAQVGQLVRVARAAGVTDEQIRGLIQRYGLIPSTIRTTIEVAVRRVEFTDEPGGQIQNIAQLSNALIDAEAAFDSAQQAAAGTFTGDVDLDAIAEQAGGTMVDGMLEGLFDGLEGQQADVNQALSDSLGEAAKEAATVTVAELVDDVLSGIEAAFAAEAAQRGIATAEDARRQAQLRLEDLRREADDLPFAIARARFEVDEADTPEARAAAFRRLQELLERQRQIGRDQAEARRDIARAEDEIVQASLRVVDAELRLAEAGREVEAAGTNIIDAFRAVAGEASVTRARAEQLLAVLQQATDTAASLGFLSQEIPAAQHGMIVDPQPGGTLVRVAEAGQREVIINPAEPARAASLLAQAGMPSGTTFNAPITIVGQPTPERTAREAVLALRTEVYLRTGD